MYTCFNLIIAYPYLLDIRVGTSLYTRCTGNYARILYICFNYNCISIFSWYTCRYEFIYRVYWKLYADHDLSFICTLCFNFIIKFNSSLLFPWYAYNKLHEFIYKVYWKLYANHDISRLFLHIHYFFNFIIVYPYFLDTPWLFLYTGCTGNYVWITIYHITISLIRI